MNGTGLALYRGMEVVSSLVFRSSVMNVEVVYVSDCCGAYLDDANLNNSWFCNTTMPDGSINNDDC